MTEVKLLSEPTNYAIVHLPERQFPGVVFQGDSLNILISELEEIEVEADPKEKAVALADVIDRLKAVRQRYENTLGGMGLKLPY